MAKRRKLKADAKPVSAPEEDPLELLRRNATAEGLLYTGSDKHRLPWQPGKRG